MTSIILRTGRWVSISKFWSRPRGRSFPTAAPLSLRPGNDHALHFLSPHDGGRSPVHETMAGVELERRIAGRRILAPDFLRRVDDVYVSGQLVHRRTGFWHLAGP